ncbi:DUF2461 domain-containing protein [Angustibacter sp. McL0619]|uniref:DUF2461 domain-containing protein n=1 Tax=Angustibacter sp. McL0619 TaxID=3415676 RepID=UPI003CF8B359
MTFDGFPARALEFYAQLEADNSKAFWTMHKTVYESQVREPLEALVDELEPEFGPIKLFRPYRDTRFSKDKSPYKTHQGAFGGPAVGVGYYVQLDSDGLLAGGGFRSHSADQVSRYREGVDDDTTGPQLVTLVDTLRGNGFDIEGDPVKTRPRGVPADHPRLELMRFRSLMVFQQFGDPDWLGTPSALDHVRDTWRQITPLADWVAEHIGAD